MVHITLKKIFLLCMMYSEGISQFWWEKCQHLVKFTFSWTDCLKSVLVVQHGHDQTEQLGFKLNDLDFKNKGLGRGGRGCKKGDIIC